MKLIFGGFEEDMSTIQPPNMKVVLPIHTELSGLIFLAYNGFILCWEFTFDFLLYLFENRDRNLQSGVIVDCRCFDSVWQPPGAIQPQILKRIGQQEAYERHSYMCVCF